MFCQKIVEASRGFSSTFIHKGEQFAFLVFLLTLPLQTRMILFASQPFEEWRAGFLYASDIFLFTVFCFWFVAVPWKSDFYSAVEVRLPRGFLRKQLILLGLFILVVGMSVLFGGHTESHSWYRFIKIGEGTLLFLYAAFRLRHVLSFQAIAWALVAGGVAQSILGFLQFVQQKSLGLIRLDEPFLALEAQGVAHIWADGFRMIRAYGTMPNPNVLAGFLAVALFFLFALFLAEQNRIKKVTLIIAQFIILGGLFLTFSRGILILFFVASWISFMFLGFIIFRTKNKNPYLLSTIYYLLAFYLLSSILYLLVLFPELLLRFAPPGILEEAAVQERYLFNVVALDAIQKSPLFGVGPGNFTAFFRESFPFMRDLFYQPAHNVFLLIATESGVPALVAFIIFVSAAIGSPARNFIARVRRCAPHASPIPAFYILNSIFFIIVTGMYDHFFWTIQQTSLLFWLVLGLGSARGNEDKINVQ